MTDRSLARCVVVDARCLQDPDYAERGVGRVAVNLLRHAPRHAGLKLIGLIDPLMPEMAPPHRDLLDGVHPNAQFRDLQDASCFVSPSPMTHDPLFIAHLLDRPGLLKAAVVYDFIPYEFPERYLADPRARHAYYTCLRWLQRYDLFMPISRASAAPLGPLLGIADDRVFVAGAALDPAFEQGAKAPVKPTHVLVIGGGDPRKNVECAIRAHAFSSVLQGGGIPLVITGHYPPAQVSAFREIAAALGGARHLLHAPGHVAESALVELYRAAICVIAPSRAEGFDLPLVEAMAAGVPALASDIAAHRELVEAADCRFDCDDHASLAGIIEAVVREPGRRKRIIERQADLWPRYRAAAVAARFWQPIEARLAATSGTPQAPAVLRGRRPRVALLSPLPPDRSGVADYTAATCAELGRLTDLHVFSETAMPAPLPGAATVRPLTPLANISSGFDRVINVLGNSGFHLRIFEQLQRYGGACISHDSRMLGFYRILLGVNRALSVASQELRRPVDEAELNRWLGDEATLEAIHYGEIATAADPVMVHSPVTASLIRERFDVAPILLPFCIYRPWEADQLTARDAARRRLGLPENEIIIATFGHVHRTKAPIESIWALEVLRGWGINAALHFIGADAEDHACRTLAAELGLADHVRFLGAFVSDEVFRDYLLGADLGIQLRLTFLGSLSGALLDCIAAGLPTVTNASLAEVMQAPSFVRAVPDNLSPLLIAEALADLLDAGLARTRPEVERHAYSEAHSFKVYARHLCAALDLEIAA